MTVRTRRAAVVVAVASALVAGGCGTDDNTGDAAGLAAGAVTVDCAGGSVTGAGSTFVANIAQQWIKDYIGACRGSSVNYQSVGSGAGIQQFIAGTVDFGASDAVMKPDEEAAAKARGGDVLHIPWSGGGIAIEYNVTGLVELRLSPATLAGIFQGTITRWNDPALKAENPTARLPAIGIQVVHRSDGSGTTDAFTKYLTAAAPGAWKAGAGKDVAWPTGQGAKGSEGVTATVKQTEGAIGYAEVSYAKGSGLGVARIRNAAGNFTAPDETTVSAALAGATTPADLRIKVDVHTANPDAYPISTPTWVLVFRKQTDPVKGRLIKSFLSYAIGEGQARAASLHYGPLPAPLAARAQAAVDSIEVR